MTEQSEYLCKDCVNSFVPLSDWALTLMGFSIVPAYMYYKCKRRGQVEEIDYNPVTGSKKLPPEYKTCREERGLSGECGRDAKYWTPKHKQDLFKLLKR